MTANCLRTEGCLPCDYRCMQIPDHIAQRGHAAFAGWCPRAARCCSLRLQLRSRSDNSALCAADQGWSPLTPRSAQPCSPAFDLRRDLASQGAVGAGLSSALSSPLSSAWPLGWRWPYFLAIASAPARVLHLWPYPVSVSAGGEAVCVRRGDGKQLSCEGFGVLVDGPFVLRGRFVVHPSCS
jgi:hypothetical protein